MTDFKQTYKNRAEAYSKFVVPQKLPVKRAKFYDDCNRLNMLQPDKTVMLGDLLAYVKTELKIDPVNGQTMEDKGKADERNNLEMRKLQAEVEKLENANKKDDKAWMQTVDHEIQMAAFGGALEEALRQATSLKLYDLIYLVGGDSGKASELAAALEKLYAEALTESVRAHVQTVAFEEDEEIDAAA